jgi:hypothetical protein
VAPPLKRPLSAYSHYLGENPEVGTHFKPEPPYDIYTRGVVHYNKSHGRRLVDLYTPAVENNGVSIKTNVVLVSTYLFQVLYWKLYGLLIPTGYQVDHIDNNKMNDTYANFQLLTPEENVKKEHRFNGVLWYTMICPVCLKQWDAELDGTQLNSHTGHCVFYCSPRCRIIFRATLAPFSSFRPLRQWIADRQLYQIVRRWDPENRRDVVETRCAEMLSFDLATACGRPVRYDTPKLLPIIDQCKLVSRLRRSGCDWKNIGGIFSMLTTNVCRSFSDVPLTDDPFIWDHYMSSRAYKNYTNDQTEDSLS